MSCRPNRPALIALFVALTMVLGLAVAVGARESVVRLTRAGGVHRFDPSDSPSDQDAGRLTLDSPTTPSFEAGHSYGGFAPAIVASIAGVTAPLRSTAEGARPASGRVPEALVAAVPGRAPPRL